MAAGTPVQRARTYWFCGLLDSTRAEALERGVRRGALWAGQPFQTRSIADTGSGEEAARLASATNGAVRFEWQMAK